MHTLLPFTSSGSRPSLPHRSALMQLKACAHRGKGDLYEGVWCSRGLLDLDAQAPGLACGYARQLLRPGTQRAVPQRTSGQVQGALQQAGGW